MSREDDSDVDDAVNLYDFGLQGAVMSDSDDDEGRQDKSARPAPTDGEADDDAALLLSKPLSATTKKRISRTATAADDNDVVVLDGADESDSKRTKVGDGDGDEEGGKVEDEDALLRRFDIIKNDPPGAPSSSVGDAWPSRPADNIIKSKLMEMKRKHFANSSIIDASRKPGGIDASGDPIDDDPVDDRPTATRPDSTKLTGGRRLQHSVLENARRIIGTASYVHSIVNVTFGHLNLNQFAFCCVDTGIGCPRHRKLSNAQPDGFPERAIRDTRGGSNRFNMI